MMNAKWIDNLRLSSKKATFLKLKNKFGPDFGFMELDHALIRYKITGNGKKTIVFVPDPPNVIEHYEKLCALLSADYRVIIFELPGLGFSLPAKMSFKYSLEDYAATTIAFLKKLNLGPYILSFPCVGGYVAVKVAEKEPALIERIITMQAPAWREELAWAKRIDTYHVLDKPLLGQLIMWFASKSIAEKWYKYALPKNNYDPDFYQLSQQKLNQGSSFCLASLTQGLFHQKIQPVFTTIDTPATVIWGDMDRSHKKSKPASATTFFSKARLYHFETCGHFPELENPEKFLEILNNG